MGLLQKRFKEYIKADKNALFIEEFFSNVVGEMTKEYQSLPSSDSWRFIPELAKWFEKWLAEE